MFSRGWIQLICLFGKLYFGKITLQVCSTRLAPAVVRQRGAVLSFLTGSTSRISGAEIQSLTEEDLKILGVSKAADRKRILKEVQSAASNAAPAVVPSTRAPGGATAKPAAIHVEMQKEWDKEGLCILFALRFTLHLVRPNSSCSGQLGQVMTSSTAQHPKMLVKEANPIALILPNHIQSGSPHILRSSRGLQI